MQDFELMKPQSERNISSASNPRRDRSWVTFYAVVRISVIWPMAEDTTPTTFFIHFRAEMFKDCTFSSTRNFNIRQSNDIVSSEQAIFAFIVTVLLNFVQLKCQGKVESPFETHPKAMLAAVTSLLVYFLSYYAMLKNSSNHHHDHPSSSSPKYTCFLRSSMVVFAPLSLASITSVLFSGSLCPLLFSLSFLFSLYQLLTSQTRTIIWDWLVKTTSNIMDKYYCDQPHQRGRRSTRRGRVSVELPWLPRLAASDEVDILPL